MRTSEEEQLSQVLRSTEPPSGPRPDLGEVLTRAHRARDRRRAATAGVGALGTCSIVALGLWAGGAIGGPSETTDPTAQFIPPVQVTGGASEATGPDLEALQRAGEAAQARMYDCLERNGVPVDRQPDGSADIGPAPGDPGDRPVFEDPTWQQMQACRAQAGFPELQPLATEQISSLYDLTVEAEQCLRDHGFDVAPAVSREDFIQAYAAMQAGEAVVAWSPYHGLDDVAATQTCPQPSLTD